MALSSECQTPGAVYRIKIDGRKVAVKVELPFHLQVDEKRAVQLEAQLHNAVEQVLAKYFV